MYTLPSKREMQQIQSEWGREMGRTKEVRRKKVGVGRIDRNAEINLLFIDA